MNKIIISSVIWRELTTLQLKICSSTIYVYLRPGRTVQFFLQLGTLFYSWEI